MCDFFTWEGIILWSLYMHSSGQTYISCVLLGMCVHFTFFEKCDSFVRVYLYEDAEGIAEMLSSPQTESKSHLLQIHWPFHPPETHHLKDWECVPDTFLSLVNYLHFCFVGYYFMWVLFCLPKLLTSQGID